MFRHRNGQHENRNIVNKVQDSCQCTSSKARSVHTVHLKTWKGVSAAGEGKQMSSSQDAQTSQASSSGSEFDLNLDCFTFSISYLQKCLQINGRGHQ
jgi:hypothetical protein